MRRSAVAAFFLYTMFSVRPAEAQFAGTFSVASNDMFRGHSTSKDSPALSVGLSYDDLSGLYLGGSVTAIAGTHVDPRIGGGTQYLGFARKVGLLSYDIGVVHRSYSHHYSSEYSTDYSEAYVGLSGRDIGARLYVSPDYGHYGGTSWYGEINATLFSREAWTLSGHVGARVPPPDPDYRRKLVPDWRIGVARRVEWMSLGLELVGVGHSYEAGSSQRLVVSVSGAF